MVWVRKSELKGPQGDTGPGFSLAGSNIPRSLVQGAPGDFTPATLTLLFGAPVYSGWGEAGAVLRGPELTRKVGTYTYEFQFFQSGPISTAAGGRVLHDWAGGYLGIGALSGRLFFNNPSDTAYFGPNICDGVVHHIAFEMVLTGTQAFTITRVWVDGVVVGSALSGSATLWHTPALGGFYNTASSAARTVSVKRYRVSFGTSGRYSSAGFTPPTTYEYDDQSILYAELSSSLIATAQLIGYPPRPSAKEVPGGAVTYIGTMTPTDALPRDGWMKR